MTKEHGRKSRFGRDGRLRGRRRAGVTVVVVSLLAATLAGCTSPRNTLGTTSSSCFAALAVATDAVQDRGSFAGVHLLHVTTAAADLHLRADVSARVSPSEHDVCVVSYRGWFRVDQVSRPLGPPPAGGHGHYAIVLVSTPQNRLIGTVIRQTQPLRFGHPF